jgi:hypothetical protein
MTLSYRGLTPGVTGPPNTERNRVKFASAAPVHTLVRGDEQHALRCNGTTRDNTVHRV